jgi:hypothetical protein
VLAVLSRMPIVAGHRWGLFDPPPTQRLANGVRRIDDAAGYRKRAARGIDHTSDEVRMSELAHMSSDE